jgi:hypothetical protein
MKTHNPDNERIKRAYFTYLIEAQGFSEATLDSVAKAINRFSLSTVSMDSPSGFSYCAFGGSRGCLGTTSAAGGHNAKALSKPRAASTLSGMR